MARGHVRSRIDWLSPVYGVIDRVTRRVRGRRRRSTVTLSDAEMALLERQKAAFARTAGILKDVEIPDWETPEKTSAWVRRQRHLDSQATDEKLSLHSDS